MYKQVTSQEDLQPKIQEAMEQLSNIVGKTLGPGGLTILLQRLVIDPSHRPLKPLATKDGVTVAKSINVKDPVLNTIISSVIEVAEKTNLEAGDGTTTAIVLANALYKEGLKYITIGERPETLYLKIQEAIDVVVKALEDEATPVEGVETIKSIATISANGDKEIGEVIGNAFDRVGEDGVITLEEGYDTGVTLDVEEGFQIDRGLMRPEPFYTNAGKEECVLQNCAIILYDEIITNEQDLLPVISKLTKDYSERNAFLVIARDFAGAAMNFLMVNRMEENLTNFAMIKAPHVGHVRTEMLKDIATLTGGKMIIPDGSNEATNLRNITSEQIGFAEKVVLTKYKTLIYNGGGDSDEVLERVEELKEAKKIAYSPYDAQILGERIASLCGGIAVIKVGGKTELEMKEKKDRVEDALNATRAAIQEGVIPGGGSTLLHISKTIKEENKDLHIGLRIIEEVIKSPIRRVISNVGETPDVIIEKILDKDDNKIGYDARQKKICNLVENNVIDPVKVTITALKNAGSIANLLLTCGGSVTIDLDETARLQSPEMPGMPGSM